MFELDVETLQEFVVEAEEHLQAFESSLLLLEKTPEDREALNEAFRAIHSIKGLANYLGLENIGNLSHQMETQLARVRGGEIPIDHDLIELQLSVKDVLFNLINAVAENKEADVDIAKVMERLELATASGLSPQPPSIPSKEEGESTVIISGSETTLSQDEDDLEEEETEDNTFIEEEIDEEDEPGPDTTISPEEEAEVFSVPDDVPVFDHLEELDLSDDLQIDLLKIPGIGKSKATALKEAGYSTVGSIRRATKEDLMKVKGINAQMAELILAEVTPFVQPEHSLEGIADDVSPAFDDIRPIQPPPPEMQPMTGSDLLKEDDELDDESKEDVTDEPSSSPIYEEDTELLEIFSNNARQRMNDIAKYLTLLEDNPHQKNILDAIQQQIKDLQASANYMGYSNVVQLLDSMDLLIEAFVPDDLPQLHNKYRALSELLLTPQSWQGEEIPEEESYPESISSHLDEEPDVDDSLDDESYISESILSEVEEPMTFGNDLIGDEVLEESIPEDMPVDSSAFSGSGKSILSKRTLRVDTEKVDNLIASVGELVVNRSSFGQISNDFREVQRILLQSNLVDKRDIRILKETRMRLDQAIIELGRTTNELQEGVMKVRMVPVNEVFSRFPRLVRTLSKEMNKDVDLRISGGDTELDKNVIEEIYDPLMHLLRNSVDHGIEPPDERRASGKPHHGTIHLAARHEGDKVIIEVRDDGRGINIERVKQVALEKHLIAEVDANTMSDKDIMNLIFHPGFSTATIVSDISGRGVGMDVVRRNVDKLKGTVEVLSEAGQFTQFRIVLPLTLAIIQSLLVKVSDEIYCIPLTSVIETERTKVAQIDTIENNEVIRLRDKVMPLLRLSEIFNVSSHRNGDGDEMDEERLFVVIVTDGMKELGLIVNSLVGEDSIVIKPFEEAYMETQGISGATIMGDGRVSLILDIPALINYAIERKRYSRLKNEERKVKNLVHDD